MGWVADTGQVNASSYFRPSANFNFFPAGSFIATNFVYPHFGITSAADTLVWIVSAPYAPLLVPIPEPQEVDSFLCRKCGGEMRLQELPMLKPYYERLKKARLCQSCFDNICNNLLMDDTPIKEDKKNKRIEGMLDALGEKK